MSICFNGFKVELSANMFTAYVQDMPDNRGLRELREKLQSDWFLHWRSGKVYGIPKVNVSQLTQSFGKPVELKCDEHLQLLADRINSVLPDTAASATARADLPHQHHNRADGSSNKSY